MARPVGAWWTRDAIAHFGACLDGIDDWANDNCPGETALPPEDERITDEMIDWIGHIDSHGNGNGDGCGDATTSTRYDGDGYGYGYHYGNIYRSYNGDGGNDHNGDGNGYYLNFGQRR